MSAHRWRRSDGLVVAVDELTEAIPMFTHELDDITFVVDLVEEWLRLQPDARLELAAFLNDDARRTTVWDVITALGAISVQLHQLAHGAPTGTPDQPY
jgi:hypothetical protein